MNKNDFVFHIPVDIEKGDDDKDWKIKGIASTQDVDQQNEIIVQKGLDISHLQDGLGLFNFDHSNKPIDIVGQVTNAQQTNLGLEVEGYLFKKQPQAQAIYNIMSSLKKGSKRRVQMSVEGKVLDRKGNKIVKAKILNVALTLNPVNPRTYAEFAKSFNSEESINGVEEVAPTTSEAPLSIAQTILNLELKIDSLHDAVNKSINTANYDTAPSERTGGAALATQSIDKKIKVLAKKIKLSYPDLDDKEIAKIAYLTYQKQKK